MDFHHEATVLNVKHFLEDVDSNEDRFWQFD